MSDYTNLNKQFINGNWIDGDDNLVIENFDPYSNQLIHVLPSASKKNVDDAFTAAKDAALSWGMSNPLFRRDILLNAASLLLKRKDEFADWLCREAGSTYIKAVIEIQQSHDILVESASFPTRMHGLTLYSSIEGKESYVYRKPLGVTGLISPWNWPLYLSMRTIAPALGTGNTVVVKPSAASLVTGGTIIGKLFEEAGIPPGVFNVVVGNSETIGDYFTSHPVPKMISFTGSTPVGKHIGRLTGESLKKAALELGGNNVFIVMEDAPVEQAAKAALFGKFLHQGQLCISINRILVHQKIAGVFLKKFIELVEQLPVGDPKVKSTVVGPLIDQKAVKRIQNLIQQSTAMGAIIETGNRAEGNVFYPTVLSNVTKEMPIFQNEIFGPVTGVMIFETSEDAVRLANATGYGLSGSLFTSNVYEGMQLARKIDAGMIHINDQTANDEIHTPFGGEKNSGTGRFGGDFILNELTTVQWVSVQKENRSYPF